MLITSFRINDYVYSYNGNPDNDVHSSISSAAVGDFFYNTVTQALFQCIQDGSMNQIWQSVVIPSSVPAAQIQSDWNQSNVSALDYIKNKPASAAARSQSAPSRSLNSIFQISASRDCLANYSVDVATSISLTGGQSGTVYLEISLSSSFASGIQVVAEFTNNQTGTLTIGLALNQTITATLTGYIPAGYYARLRTANNTGTPTFTYQVAQEVLL